MGHIRLGRLPKSARWNTVVGSLGSASVGAAHVAAKTAEAADSELRRLGGNPSLSYCFWLLASLASTSRTDSFFGHLQSLGVEASPDQSVLSLIARLSEHTRSELGQLPPSGPFGELASLSLRRALLETVGQYNLSLFGSSVTDLQRSFREYSASNQFGTLARRFFGDFLARTLHYFVDKELSNHVGGGRGVSDILQSHEFSESLDVYAHQSARIVEDFAGGWYSKHNWESRGHISRQEARAFVAIALRKLRMEVAREGGPP